MRSKKLLGLTIVVAAALGPAAGAQAGLPAIGPVQHGEVKWILPPNNPYSLAYDNVKASAEGAGYETVENDDLTYDPTPRP
jgi:hypothetical protein